ncbi:MAG: hypothetical protein AAB347_03900 [Bacteroidota bacterium]
MKKFDGFGGFTLRLRSGTGNLPNISNYFFSVKLSVTSWCSSV